MKQITLKGSILPNTNKIVSESYMDWKCIKDGNLIKFKNDNVFYHVAKVEPHFYIKDYEVINDYTLLIKDNTSVYLNKGDSLLISYKEYELLNLYHVVNGGRNYKVDDILFLEGGTASNLLEDGSEQKGYFRVLEVLPGGIITKIMVENKGKYIETPEKKCNLRGGNGTGAILEVNFKLLDARAHVERDIAEISIGDKTIITLTYPIPKAVKEGKISTEKFSITTVETYLGKEKKGEFFEVIRDFTSNYGLVLLLPNSTSTQILINQNMVAIDKVIFDLQQEIQTLKKEVAALQIGEV